MRSAMYVADALRDAFVGLYDHTKVPTQKEFCEIVNHKESQLLERYNILCATTQDQSVQSIDRQMELMLAYAILTDYMVDKCYHICKHCGKAFYNVNINTCSCSDCINDALDGDEWHV